MTDREEQRERFREALERKSERARRQPGRPGSELEAGGGEIAPSQRDLVDDGPADVLSPRKKSSGHGKKTAEKWNQ
jgi:hypothetical protein